MRRNWGEGKSSSCKNNFLIKGIIAIFSALIFAMSLGVALSLSKNNEAYALSDVKIVDDEVALQATGTLTSVSVEVDYTKTNANGVAGIFTSMTPQDLVEYNYLTVTAHYDSGENEVVDSGYTVSMPDEYFSAGNVNRVTLSYNDVSTSFAVNATQVALTILEIDTSGLSGVDFNEGTPVNDLSGYIKVTGKNNDGSVFNNQEEIPFDVTGENGYTLEGPSSGELAVGNNEIVASYNNATGRFSVTALEKVLTSISAVFEQPETPIYSSSFVSRLKSYLTVYAYYNNSDEGEILDRNLYNVEGNLFTQEDELESETVLRTCTVSVIGNEDIKDTFSVRVIPDIPLSVMVTLGDYNMYYYALDEFNPDGIMVMVNFQYGGMVIVEDNFYIDYIEDDNRLHVTDTYVKIGYRENGAEATLSSEIPVEVEQMQIQRVSISSHDLTYIEEDEEIEDEEEQIKHQTQSVNINYFASDRMTITIAEDSDPGMTIDNGTGRLSAINAGVYKVLVKLNADYVWQGGSTEPIILEWEIKPLGFVANVEISNWYYGQSPYLPTVSENPGKADDIEYYYYGTSLDGTYNHTRDEKYTTAPTVTGTYRIYAYIPRSGNYAEYTTADSGFEVLKANNNITASDYNWQYDENNINKVNPQFTAKFTLETNYSISYYQNDSLLGTNNYNKDGTLLSENEYFPQNAGSYVVRIYIEGTINYYEVSKDITLTITNKPIDVDPTIDISDLTFTGSGASDTVQSKVLSNYNSELMTFKFESTDGAQYSSTEASAYYQISGTSITFYMTNVIENGGYKVTISINDNYAWTNSSTEDLVFEWKILQATNSVSITNAEVFEAGFDYVEEGVSISPTYTATFYQQNEPTVTYYRANGEELGENLGSTNPVDAGTYFVVVEVKETTNYSGASDRCKFEIRPKVINVPVLTSDSTIYDTLMKTTTITGYDSVSMTISDDATTVNYEVNESVISLTETNAGSYVLGIELISGNYVWSDQTDEVKTYTWTIEKASLVKPTLTYSSNYTASSQQIDLTTLGVNSNMSLSEDDRTEDIGLTLSGYTLSAVDAREYSVVISIIDNSNYKWAGETDDEVSESLTFVWTINKAVLTVNWGGVSFNYSGRTLSPTPTFEGWLGTDMNGASGNYTTQVLGGQINAGDNYTATLSIVRKDGGNVNYSLSSTSTQFSIAKALITITWADTDLTYNGVEQTPEFTATDFAVASDANVYSFEFSAQGKDVGSYQTTLSLASNNQTMNYELENNETGFTISEATLSVEWRELSFEYDGTIKQPSPIITGYFGEDESLYNVAVSVDRESMVVGTYTATLTLSHTQSGKVNYDLSDYEEDFEIFKARVNVGNIVSEPEGIEGNENLTDRRMPFTGEPLELVVEESVDGIYDYATNKYLNSEFAVVTLEDMVSAGQVFYVVLELKDADNYQWYNYNANDSIVDDGKTIRLWFEITQTQYDMQLSITGLDENNEIIYGESFSYKVDNNLTSNTPVATYYSLNEDNETTLLDSAPVNVGRYRLSVSIGAEGDYDSMTSTIDFSIVKREVGVTILVEDGTYGDWKQATVSETITNQAGNGFDVLTTDNFVVSYVGIEGTEYDLTTTAPVNVGRYQVIITLEHDNYEIAETIKEFEITRASLTLTAADDEITYGQEDPTVLYSGSSYVSFEEGQLKNGDTIDDIGISFIYASNYKQGDDASSYEIYLSAYEDDAGILDNYHLTIIRGTLVVNKMKIDATVDIDGQSFAYDGDNIYRGSVSGATATPSEKYGDDIIEFSYLYTGSSSYSSTTAPINAGEYNVVVTLSENSAINYELSKTIATFTITRVNLNLTIKNAEITYGDEDPTETYNNATYLSFDETELQGDDTIDTIGLDFVYTSNYVQGDDVGEYKIYLGNYGESDVINANITNYTLKINAGTLTVNKKLITVTVDVDGKSFVYDGNNIYLASSAGALATPSWSFDDEILFFTYTYQGTGETTYEESETAPTEVGTYTVSVILTPESESDKNYSFEGTAASFEITQKEVEVIWSEKDTFVYNGQNQSLNGGITASYEPADDDTIGEGVLSIEIVEGESAFVNAGAYTFEANLTSSREQRNYKLIGNLTKDYIIEQAEILEITWNYTEENHFVYNGNVLSTDLIFATFVGVDAGNHNLVTNKITKNESEELFRDAGDYQISVMLSERDAQNYVFDESVELVKIYTIENADITLNGDVIEYSGIYDAQNHNVATTLPELNYVQMAGTPRWTFRVKTEENTNEYVSELMLKHVGTYTIEYKISLINHNDKFGEFEVSISKKDLVLTAETEIQFGNNITQNIEDYIITSTSSGMFAEGEDYTVLGGNPVFEVINYNAGESEIGEYVLNISGFTSNDYNISYTQGVVNVIPREIEITISKVTRTYGEGLTSLSANTYSSISNGGLIDVLPEEIYNLAIYLNDEQVALTENLDVGSYDVKPVDINKNYNIVQVISGEGAYVIEPRPISISITGNSYEYDGKRHGVTAQISTEGVDLDIRTLYSSDTYGGENGSEEAPWEVGTYKVIAQIVDDDEAGNYQIGYEAGSELTIYPRAISITIENQSADYNGKEPTVSSVMGDSENHQNWYISSTKGLCENVTGELDDLNVVLSIPTNSVNAGTYTISGSYNNKNYDVISWNTGEFTINQLQLEVKIENQTITYGYEHNNFVLTYTGFIAGEDENTAGMFNNGVPSAVCDYEIGDDVGNYDINFANQNITSRNYKLSYVTGVLTVEEREIALNILKQNSNYSGNKPSVSSNLGEGFEVTSVEDIYLDDDLNIKIDIEEAEVYNAGTYDVTYSYNNANYIVTWQENSWVDAFVINKVILTVKAVDVEVQYGNQPVNSYEVSGFVNNEDENVIQGLGQITFNNVGYTTDLGVNSSGEITLNGIENLSATNYTFTDSKGQWTVIKRNINVEVDESQFYNGNKDVYGEYDTDTLFNKAKVNVVFGGLVNDDTQGDEGDVDILFNYAYYGTSNDGTWNYTSTSPSAELPDKAGRYKVDVTITSENYRLNSENEVFTIEYIIFKHRVVTPSWQTSSFDATGESKTNTLNFNAEYSRILTSSHPITNEEDGVVHMTAQEGGEYSVTLILLDENNYVWASSTGSPSGDNPSVTIKWTISQNNDNEFTSEMVIMVGEEEISVIEIEDRHYFDYTWTYGEELSTPQITAKYGEVEFRYHYAGNSELVGEKPTNAGNYYVVAYVEGTADWNGIEYEPVYFTIQAETLTMPTIENAIYNDGAVIKQQVYGFDYNDMVVLGSNVELVYEGDALYLQARDVYLSDYYVNIALRDSRNYKWNDDSTNAIRLTWKVSPKLVEKPTLNEQTFVYDGSLKEFELDNGDYYMILSGGSATDVGNYQVVVSLVDNTNYNWTDNTNSNLTQNWSITAKGVLVPTIEAKIYNHGEVVKALINNYDNSALSIDSTGDAFVTTEPIRSSTNYYINAFDAKTYNIVFSLRDSKNYKIVGSDSTSIIVEWTVSKYSVKVPTLPQGQSYTYNGKEINYQYTDSIDRDYYTVTGATGVDANEYNVVVSLVDKNNYIFENGDNSDISQVWNIMPATDNKLTIENQEAFESGWTYGEDAVELLVSDTYNGEITFDYYRQDDTLLEGVPTDAGNYYVVITSHSDENNFNDATVELSFEIKKAEYNLDIKFSNMEVVFDGEAHTVLIEGELPGGLTVNYTSSSGDIYVTNVSDGVKTITASFTNANTNYNTPENLQATIEIKAKTIENIVWSCDDLIYNGVNKEVEAKYFDIDNEEIALSTNIVMGESEFKNVGAYIFEASLPNGGNYKIDETTQNQYKSFEILPLEIELKVVIDGEKTVTYGAELPNIKWEYIGESRFIDSDNIKVDITDIANIKTVGEYDIVISLEENTALKNYQVNIANDSLNITKRKLTVNVIGDNESYYGENIGTIQYEILGDAQTNGDVLTIIEGDNNVFNLTTSASSRSDVGSYPIEIIVNNNNYDIELTPSNYEIKKAKLTIIPNSYSITYGEEMPEIDIQANGLVNNDTILELGTIIVDCNYDVSNPENRKAGVYQISLSGLASSNYDISYQTANLVVTRKNIEVTLENQSSDYSDGEPIVLQDAYSLNGELAYVDDDLNISIYKEPGVNAGTYHLNAEIDNENYNITVNPANYIINKIVIEPNEIAFNDIEVVADGNIHSIEISGTIPAGMLIEYTNNIASLPGIYHATATLKYDDQNVVYNGETSFEAIMTINKNELSVQDDYRQDKIVITTTNGFNPNYDIDLSEIKDFSGYDLSEYDDLQVVDGYKVNILDENEIVSFNQDMQVSLLLPNTSQEYVILINSNGELSEVEYALNGNYAIFSTSELGEIIVMEKIEEENMLWLVLVLSGILLLLLIWFTVVIVKAKKSKDSNKDVKVKSVAPLSLLALALPLSQFVAMIVIGGISLIMLILCIVLTVKNKRKKNNETILINVPVVQNEEKTEESTVFSQLRKKSFFTKLRGSDQETRDKYHTLKKYIKTLSGVNLATSKKQVRVFKGGKTLANIFFRGKTLCITLALNPQDYAETKYKGEDVSSVKRFQNTPMLIRLTSSRKVEYSKYLLSQCLKELQ